MKKSVIILVAMVIAVLCTSCKKNEITISTSQKILFECFYINFAWGYNHQGFFIDNEGRIMDYSQYGNYNDTIWNFPDNQGNISEQALMENLQKTTIRDILIDTNILKKYADKIYLVTNNDFTEYHASYDAGSIVYVCYRYDENTRIYEQVLLSQEGDWVKINNNEYALQISNWLTSIY
jgi:hypothetical protein